MDDPRLRLPDVDALLELIIAGDFDDHLEAILAAAHGRKRQRRSIRRPYGLPVLDQAIRVLQDEPFSEGDGIGIVETAPPFSDGGPLTQADLEAARPVREHVIPGRACG